MGRNPQLGSRKSEDPHNQHSRPVLPAYNSILDEIQEWILFLYIGDPGSFYTAIFRYASPRRPGLR